jgi:CheY-like chemotaxis protein
MSGPESVILMVEDEPVDALLMQRAFENARLHHRLHVVGDGEAAVSYLTGEGAYADRESHPLPALVLLDLKLPHMSGLELLAWMRSRSAFKRLPVVVLTSSSESSDVNRAYELGANSYLVKPIAYDALLRVVETLILSWRASVAPPAEADPTPASRRRS